MSLFFILLYQSAIRLYRGAIFFFSFFNKKAKLWIEGRKGWKQSIKEVNKKEKLVWVHAASLGEYEQARPIIEELKTKTENVEVLVTFFSPSGYEVRKNDDLPDWIKYMPLDTKQNASIFLNAVKPDLAVFIRYEFWPNFIDALQKRKIPTTVVSAHFRQSQFLFKPLGAFIKKRLFKLKPILVQYQQSKDVLVSNGYPKEDVFICGDSRIDRVFNIANEVFWDEKIECFKADKKLLILGSSYTDEESFTFPLMEKEKDLKILIAPHYIDEGNINRIVSSTPVKTIRYTEDYDEQKFSEAQVMVLDTMGMLASVYQYGNYALIGGGFKDGIHSILEPAAQGLPLFFGPDHLSFTEAASLIEKGGAVVVKNQKEFLNAFLPIYEGEDLCRQKGAVVRSFIDEQKGAAIRIVDKLAELI